MDLMKWSRMAALLTLPLMLGACASSSEHNALQAQVNQMTRQMSSSQTSQADSWSQIVELRQEVADLKGQLDTLNHALQRVGGAQKLAETQAVHSRALRLVESQMAMDLQLDSASPAPAPAQPGSSEPAMMPAAQQQELQTAVQQPVIQQPAVQQPVQAPAAAKPATTDIAKALYDNGMNSFNARKYSAALKSFSDFTSTYPKHKLASNAWFWQGESQYQLKRYGEAALAYNNVITGSPNAPKAPACYLKQGMAFIQLKKNAAAKQRLTELIRKYPKAPEAARAKQVISQNKL
ncbi:MAG: tol-pal system protein YbgF [Mailhella sp.]|nr:tol-pal system protein YbgF [Mailhella sp.]